MLLIWRKANDLSFQPLFYPCSIQDTTSKLQPLGDKYSVCMPQPLSDPFPEYSPLNKTILTFSPTMQLEEAPRWPLTPSGSWLLGIDLQTLSLVRLR